MGSAPSTDQEAKRFGQIFNPDLSRMRKKRCCSGGLCCKVVFVILCVLVMLLSIVEMAVAISTAIATKMFSSDLSGRMVAMILLAVTAAIALSACIYAVIAVFKKKTPTLNVVAGVLSILLIIQAVIAGVSVKVSPDDEINLSDSLIESFKMAREGSPRHNKLWTMTQYDLNCCGVYSSQDYSVAGISGIIAPDVPISCCPSFDPNRSELVQERSRQICKIQREFYNVGCKSIIIELFESTSALVLSITVILIVLELLTAIWGSCLAKDNEDDQDVRSEKSHKSGSKRDIEDGGIKTKG